MSVRLSAWNNSAPAGRMFNQIRYLRGFFFRKICRENSTFLKIRQKKERNVSLYEDLYTFMTISRSIHLIRMRSVSDKICIEN